MLPRRRRAGEGPSFDLKPSLTMAPRKSLLDPLKSGFLRRHSEPHLPGGAQKQPLLALNLSSPSFLDSSIIDEDADSTQPLYRIKTSGTSTTVLRRDPTKSTVLAASIKWPKNIPLKRGKDGSDGILLLMKDSRWTCGDSLLKPASKDGSRKFHIPNYNQAMKWKQHGAQYTCTTPAVQGPIATFEPRKGNQPHKLTVYETLHDKRDPTFLLAFRGVSILLLDYLVVTSLLLVTDLQEWMLVRKFEGRSVNLPHPSDPIGQAPSSAPGVPGAASNPQWRKIAFGEPIFPKIAGDAKSIHGEMPSSMPLVPPSRQASIMTRSDGSSSSQRSPGLGMRSFIDTDLDSEDDSDLDETFFDGSRAGSTRRGSTRRALSPMLESPSSSINELSRSYVDPSYYRPPSPLEEAALSSRPSTSIAGRSYRSQPSSPLSESFHYPDEPLPPIPQSLRRARSVSPVSPILDDPEVLTDMLNGYQLIPNRPSRPFLPPQTPTPPPVPRITRLRSDSIGSSISTRSRRRPLPQPPTAVRPEESAWAEVQALRRAQSSNALLENASSSSMFTSPRVTPPIPEHTPSPLSQGSRILPASPQVQIGFHDMGPVPLSPENYGEPIAGHLHPHTAQHYLHSYDADEVVHSRQPPITKSSHEDLARWLHDLTVDSSGRIHHPEPLPDSSIYDVPPPAYNSITFSNPPPQARLQQRPSTAS